MINFISSFWVVLSVPCGWRTAKLFEPLAGNNHSLLCILLLSAFPIIEPISDRNYSPSLFTQQSIFAAVSFLWVHWYFPVHLDPSVLHLGHPGLVLQKEDKNASLRMHRYFKSLALGTLQSSEAVDVLGRYVHLPFVACGDCILLGFQKVNQFKK